MTSRFPILCHLMDPLSLAPPGGCSPGSTLPSVFPLSSSWRPSLSCDFKCNFGSETLISAVFSPNLRGSSSTFAWMCQDHLTLSTSEATAARPVSLFKSFISNQPQNLGIISCVCFFLFSHSHAVDHDRGCHFYKLPQYPSVLVGYS